MKLNDKFIPVLCVIFGFLLGIVGGKMYYGNLGITAGIHAESHKARLAVTPEAPTELLEVTFLSGTIKEISEKMFTIALNYPIDPLGDPALDVRIVHMDNQTKITAMVEKDPEIYKKEVADFQEKMVTMRTKIELDEIPPPPPESLEKKTIDSSMLEVEDNVTITTEKNVKYKKSFIALTIDRTSSPKQRPFIAE